MTSKGPNSLAIHLCWGAERLSTSLSWGIFWCEAFLTKKVRKQWLKRAKRGPLGCPRFALFSRCLRTFFLVKIPGPGHQLTKFTLSLTNFWPKIQNWTKMVIFSRKSLKVGEIWPIWPKIPKKGKFCPFLEGFWPKWSKWRPAILTPKSGANFDQFLIKNRSSKNWRSSVVKMA